MTEKLKRVYAYEDTIEEVREWAKRTELETPNRKENFPFSLQQYIKHLKFKGGKNDS